MSAERLPTAAGRFYPSETESCARMVDSLLPSSSPTAALGAVVPHAGWVYSGRTAALSLSAVAGAKPDTVVLFGAAHGATFHPASIYARGSWRTPIGSVAVDEELASLFLQSNLIVDAPQAHQSEHSLEVQIPLIQRLLPESRIVPINVLPGPEAPHVGKHCAERVGSIERKVVFVGSTDLTHYGPAFGFEPRGRGIGGIRWAKEVNDRRFVSLISKMESEKLVSEAAVNRNACGPGAIAALVSAMRELGFGDYDELEHTCSAEVTGALDAGVEDSVGYEAGVFRSTSVVDT